jgi:RNA polymerase sigma-70 factor (ECF subfamily)
VAEGVEAIVSATYRSDWGRILATVIRTTGDFTIAEESTQEAFEAALGAWRTDGVPENPRAWLMRTSRNIAIDRLRRRQRLMGKLETYAAELPASSGDASEAALEIPDDRLRLIFTCCHPALALEAQVALTLRTLAGLQTDEIARAFLVQPATMAQRLVRAKRKITEARIPYIVPEAAEMPERLHAVLEVLYLVFNEGYAATRGAAMMRSDLCAEAIRLVRLVRELTGPAPPSEVSGLLALLLLQDSRRDARVDQNGDLIVLGEQDRSLWHKDEIEEALPLVVESLSASPGPFALQAAIAAVHARAERREDTNWQKILELYTELDRLQPSPVVALNRTVAVAMVSGPAAALALADELAKDGALAEYHLLHAARADYAFRLRDFGKAEKAYLRALELVGNDSERRFLKKRLDEVRERQREGG